jgi:nucleoside 2-deoxyribosyltransferase
MLAGLEIDGIRNADVLIALLPGGFGTHVEIGAALAFGKPIIIHSPNQTVLETPYPCVFHYHPLVRLIVSGCMDIDAVLSFLPS